MYGSAFYKMGARTRLKGNYSAAVIGALIYLIPQYICDLLGYVFPIGGLIISILFLLLFYNVFSVGYMRFLLEIKPSDEPDSEKKNDYNLVLSGFTQNFKNTFKTTFLKEIKIIGWFLLTLVPIVVFAGIAVFVIRFSGNGQEMYSYFAQMVMSPTMTTVTRTVQFFSDNYEYLIWLMILAISGSFALMIPYLYKTYEYAVITMIVADKPDMSTSDVFERTKSIMDGFRMRYFLVQLSFLLYEFVMIMILQTTASSLIYYIAMSFLIPYMYMTFLEFYRERSNVIDYNISIYGNKEIERND